MIYPARMQFQDQISDAKAFRIGIVCCSYCQKESLGIGEENFISKIMVCPVCNAPIAVTEKHLCKTTFGELKKWIAMRMKK